MFHTTTLAALFCLTGAQAMAADLAGLWTLTALDGAEVAFAATLDLTEPGRLAGKAPCNSYAGKLGAEGDAFIPGPILSTKMACDGLADDCRLLVLTRS